MNVFKMYFLNYEMYYKSSISKFPVLRKDKRDILLRKMRKKRNSILKGWFESFIFFLTRFQLNSVLIFQTTSLLLILLKAYEKN